MQSADNRLSNLSYQTIIWRKHLRSRCLIEVQQISFIPLPGEGTRHRPESYPSRSVQIRGVGKSGIVRVGLAARMKFLEDKAAIGGPGLVAARKPKAGISMQKAYGFLVWTRVQSPPAPQIKRKSIIYKLLFLFSFFSIGDEVKFVPIVSSVIPQQRRSCEPIAQKS